MKKMILAVLFIVGVVLAGTRLGVAQEAVMGSAAAVGAQEAENDKFSFGKVVSVGEDQITIKEYDFAKDADVEVVYAVTSETELGNINAVKDLAADDDVVIDYTENAGKRVVTTLVKEEKGAEVPVAALEDGAVAPADDIVPADDAAPAENVMVETPAETAPVQE